MPWDYSDKVLQLFTDAVKGAPGTHMGEIEHPDGYGEHGSIVCGDTLRFSFRVRRDPDDPMRDVIIEARYLTFGCTSAIASSEALCALLEQQRKTPIEALQVTNQDLVDFLGGLPEQKIHCSVMGAEALHGAVADWARKRGVDLQSLAPGQALEDVHAGRVVCRCYGVTEPYLRRKILELGLRSIPEITHALKAGGGCTGCHHEPGGLQELLDEIWGAERTRGEKTSPAEPSEGRADEPYPYQLGRRIETVIDGTIRPQLRQDGADIELIDIKGQLVYCRLTETPGSCAGAAGRGRQLVERILRNEIDARIEVITL